MILITEKETDPGHNLAREEFLLNCEDEDLVYLWRNRPSVIVGRHQNTWAEVDLELAERERIPVIRRLTGGGAVFHDLGNINISFFFSREDFEEKAAERTGLLLRFLHRCGLDAQVSGRNDICVETADGRQVKIAGTAMTERDGRGLFHLCLLYDCDLTMMQRLLTPSVKKLETKGIHSVRARVANVRQLLAADRDSTPEADGFFRELEDFFRGFCKEQKTEETGGDTEMEQAELGRLRRERYENWQWNTGRNPAGSLTVSARFPAGEVTMELTLEKGCISGCRFSGDYFDGKTLEKLAARLAGRRYERKSVEQALREEAPAGALGTADREKLLDFLMGGSR